jgi:hypothetical protein
MVTGRRQGGSHPICGFLGMNAHANFLAASSAALRGQSPATFMLIRGCFESAIYAFIASLSRDDAEAWMDRTENPVRAKALFSANRGIQKLEARDRNLAVMAKDSYEWMINFGGHPNNRSIVDHIRIEDTLANGDIPFSLIYLNSPGSLAVVRALAACIENGCMAVAILTHTFSDHDAASSVFPQVWEIFKEFEQIAIDEGYLDREWHVDPSAT